MIHITFEEMIKTELNDILNNYSSGYHKYYHKNDDDNKYYEIIELDLLRGRFTTEDRDFFEFEWELKESNIYMEEYNRVHL